MGKLDALDECSSSYVGHIAIVDGIMVGALSTQGMHRVRERKFGPPALPE